MEKKLYAKDNKGNVLIWSVAIINSIDKCDLYIFYGRLDGEKTVNYEKNIKGVNIGKSNETKAYEQAENRLQSRVNLKKRKGYIELDEKQQRYVDDCNNSMAILYLKGILPDYRKDLEGFIKPMKAAQYYRSRKDWKDPKGKIWKDRKYYYLQNPYEVKEKGAIIAKFPMMGQPKINGVRALIGYDEDNEKAFIKSKEGLLYEAVPHINEACEENKYELFGQDLNRVLDGELYIERESLQVIQSAVKAVNLNTSRVIFILYDVAIPEWSNEARWQIIKNLELSNDLIFPIIKINTFKVNSDAQAQSLTDKFIKLEHEGLILRDFNAPYQFGARKNTMLKLKRTISEDFTIVRIEPQPKRPDLALFVCSHKGEEFKVNPTFSDEMKALIMLKKHEYINKKLQTTFYEWTDDNKPLHVIDTIIRDYE